MSSIRLSHPPHRRLRRRLTALATTFGLACAGLAVLSAPAHAAPSGVTTAYVGDQYTGTVSVVDTASGAITATVSVGGYVEAVAVNPAGTRAYAASAVTNVVSVIDTATESVTATIPVGSNPSAVALNPAGTTAYVMNESSHSVSVIDTGTNAVTATITGIPGFASNLSLNPSGTTAYVASFSPNTLTVIDTGTGTDTITASVPLGGSPYAVAVNPSGTIAYVAVGGDNTIAMVDTATDTVTGTIAIPTPISLAFTPDGAKLYAVNGGGKETVSVIDTASSTITATITGFADPQKVAVASTGGTVYLTDQINPSGTVPGTLWAIDTATNTVSANTTGLAGGPNALALHTVPAPTVTSVSPNSGPLAAGTPVTITGTNLTGTTAITFGADGPATGVSCTATSCTATAPAGVAGTVDVTVTGPGGTSATGSADQYTYVAAPVVTAVSPTHGPEAGGTTVTVTGTGLSGAAIAFGPIAATGVSCTAISCTATAPAQADGTVDVTATTVGGTSAAGSADHYTYDEPAPAVTGISPALGPITGGTTVTITGTDFNGATAVRFGTVAATSFTVNSDTQITATAPAVSTPGPVDVTVTTAAGTSATGTADRYAYVNDVAKVTASGRLDVGSHDAEFGFAARRTTSGGTIKGRLTYDNDNAGVRIKDATITTFYLTSANTAYAAGTASCTIGGTTSTCSFTVSATDNGDAAEDDDGGTHADTFILTYNTTTVGGRIEDGHVEISPETGGDGHDANTSGTTSGTASGTIAHQLRFTPTDAALATATTPIDATPATAAMTGGFSASLLGITLSGGRCATGVLVYTDGTAAGDTNCLLLGLLGINIDLNLRAATGTVGTGTTTVTGTATVTVAGLLPVTLPATEVLNASGSTGLQLTIGGVTLPALPIGTGAIQIG